MILTREYETFLDALCREYFVTRILFVEDLGEWVGKQGGSLFEPHQPMKLVPGEEGMTLGVQAEVEEGAVADVLKAMGVRWALRDTASDPVERLNSNKKRLAFCFFKEYARTVPDVAGDDLIEDEWAFREMERLGFFKE